MKYRRLTCSHSVKLNPQIGKIIFPGIILIVRTLRGQDGQDQGFVRTGQDVLPLSYSAIIIIIDSLFLFWIRFLSVVKVIVGCAHVIDQSTFLKRERNALGNEMRKEIIARALCASLSICFRCALLTKIRTRDSTF